MCRRIECPRCGRPGFAGCGMHVEQVLAGVSREERCRCHEQAASTDDVRRAAPESTDGSWLSRVLRTR